MWLIIGLGISLIVHHFIIHYGVFNFSQIELLNVHINHLFVIWYTSHHLHHKLFLSMYRSSGPPLSAIDRFLCGQQPHIHVGQSNHLCSFGSSGTSNYKMNMWPNYTEGPGFADGLLLTNDQEVLNNLTQTQISTLYRKEDMQVSGKRNGKVVGRRSKSVSSESLIKGNWTDEEDR